MLDLLIFGAEVYDGDQVRPRSAAVGLAGDSIAYVGPDPGAAAARRRVDARGLLLSPGFIDPHASTGLGYFFDRAGDHKLFQGVATEVIGNCGTSPAPVGPRLEAEMEERARRIGFPFDWRSLGEYFARLETRGVPLNVGTLAGHSTLRAGALADWREPAAGEVAELAAALEGALEDGALGLSTGLIYPPGCYAPTAELVALARIAAARGGIYASHVRDERAGLEEAVDEALEIGRASGAPVLVSHLKAAERPNWGKIPDVIRRIDDFRRRHGVAATFDVYPYAATSTRLRAYLPPELFERGIEAGRARLGAEDERRRAAAWLAGRGTDLASMTVISGARPQEKGKSVVEIAGERGRTPEETVCDLVREDPETWIVYHCISEDDLDAAVLWPDSLVCSDSWSYPVNAPVQIGEPHPRTFGAFSRFLARYVFDRPLLSYGEAVRKITSRPADFLGLAGRGRIREGDRADLVLLDPARFADRATYERPRLLARGVAHLWINGRKAIEEEELVDVSCGSVLRRAA